MGLGASDFAFFNQMGTEMDFSVAALPPVLQPYQG
jgi:hypothetical protein